MDKQINDLMKTNCYDVNDTMIIVGSCMPKMQPKAFEELCKISNNIYEVCLESTHINMVITKIIGMLCRVKVNKIIYASVDKSPHCVQLHYIDNEVRKALDLSNTEIIHFVSADNKLIEIQKETISLSKNLAKLNTY